VTHVTGLSYKAVCVRVCVRALMSKTPYVLIWKVASHVSL
jgi:hypothetical protein